MFDGTHFMWGMHWLGWIVWLLLIGGIFWAIVRSQQGPSSGAPPSEPRETPLETLQRRYAEGELSTEEYEERKERLENDL